MAMAVRGAMVCRLLGKFYYQRCSRMREVIAAVVVEANNGCRGGCCPCDCILVEAFVSTCGLIGGDNNRGCRGDCCPCECIVVEIFVFACQCTPIGRDSIPFLKVAPFLDAALFSSIRMLRDARDALVKGPHS